MEHSPVIADFPVGTTDVLIAIQSQHASKIYSGKKSYELRRSVPREIPKRIFLYETADAKCVTGFFVVNRVVSGAPDVVWRVVGTKGTTKQRYEDYFINAGTAYAIEIGEVVKFDTPISLSDLTAVEPSFKVPQNFLYLSNFEKLHHVLAEKAFYEASAKVQGAVTLSAQFDSQEFVRLVGQHISGSYMETGEEYGLKLLDIARRPIDPEGVFTAHKKILSILYAGVHCGYIVLTFKRGGCVKTGPLILLPEFTGRGIGGEVREATHHLCRFLGIRKVYCSVPAIHVPAVSYLLKSGYKVEAHLSRQYHSEHDEIVFAKRLAERRYRTREYARPLQPLIDYSRLEGDSSEVAAFFASEFADTYFAPEDGWVPNQIREAVHSKRGFRPRRIFVARSLGLAALAFCVIKRGGSAKIILLSRTSHRRSMAEFIQYVEYELWAENRAIRRFYTHVPACDQDSVEAFLSAGYSPEGVLDSPYSETIDMLALGKRELIAGPIEKRRRPGKGKKVNT